MLARAVENQFCERKIHVANICIEISEWILKWQSRLLLSIPLNQNCLFETPCVCYILAPNSVADDIRRTVNETTYFNSFFLNICFELFMSVTKAYKTLPENFTKNMFFLLFRKFIQTSHVDFQFSIMTPK